MMLKFGFSKITFKEEVMLKYLREENSDKRMDHTLYNQCKIIYDKVYVDDKIGWICI